MKSLLQRPWFLPAVFALVFCLQVVPRWWSDSLNFDEAWEITSGYEYWKFGDVWSSTGSTASGSLPSLPLLALDLKREPFLSSFILPYRTQIFVFLKNQDRLTQLTALARSANLILCLLTLLILVQWVKASPLPEKIAVLALWAFDPTWLAFGGTAKSDCAGAFWMLLMVFFFKRVQEKATIRGYMATGLLCAIATTSRHTDFSAPLILLALEAAALWSHLNIRAAKKTLLRWAALSAGYVFWIALVFLPGTFQQPSHFSPFHYYLNQLRSFSNAFVFLRGLQNPGSGDFWAMHSRLFFPFHYFFKSTLPWIILLGMATILCLRGRFKLENWIWIPPTVHLSLIWILYPQLLPRYVLPASPFLILAAAKTFQWIWDRTRNAPSGTVRFLPVFLLVWHALSVAAQWPGHISYTNECMPKKYVPRWLARGTWQLDQDVKRLAETGNLRGWKHVKWIATDRIDPYFYGLNWEPWTRDELRQPRSGAVYVVDAALFLESPEHSRDFNWRESWLITAKPTGHVGMTWYYYEIPGVYHPAPPSPYVTSVIGSEGGCPFYRRAFQPGNLSSD